MKRTAGILLLLLILFSAAYTLYEMSNDRKPLSDPWSRIPPGSAFVLEVSDPLNTWSELANRSQVWRSLRLQPQLDAIHILLKKAFDDAIGEAPMTPFSSRPIIMSFELIDKDEYGILTILSASKEVNKDQLLELLGCMDPAIIASADKITENDYTLQLDSSLGKIHVRQDKDLLLISTHRDLLDPLSGDTAFTSLNHVVALRNTFGKGADAHLLVNTEKVDDLIDIFIHPEQNRQLDLPAGYAALDVEITADQFLVSGVMAPDELEDIQALGQIGGPNRPQEMVPQEAGYLYATRIEEPLEFTNRFLQPGSSTYQQASDFRDSLSIDLQEFFSSWMNGELVIALDNKNPSEKWVCARTFDRYTVIKAFERLVDAFENKGSTVRRSDTKDRITFHLPTGLPLSMFGPAFEKLYGKHFGIMGDVVVMASTENGLSRILSSLGSQRTLVSSERALNQFSRLPGTNRLMLWCDLARSKELASHYVNVNKATGDTSVLDAFGTMSLVVGERINDLHHVSLSLEHAPITRSTNSKVRWKAELSTPVQRKPDILDDHTSSGKNVLIQDTEHVLHFFSSAGDKLWERELADPIKGMVHQIDRYRNGKLQMLFNTREKIHLIDRNGRNVDGFPISIPGETSAPIAVVDYDNDGEKRILCSSTNGKLFNFQVTGEKVDGWDPIKLDGSSDHAMRHVRIKTKDYILVLENTGKVHLLDRRGQPRFNPTLSMIGLSDEGVHVQESLSIGSSLIWWSDTIGRIWSGEFGGSAELLSEQPWSNARVVFADMDEDGEIDMIRSAADSVSILSSSVGLTTFHTPGNITGRPSVFNFGQGKRLLGLSVEAENGLFLYNLVGVASDYDGLEGSTSFSISDLNADGSLEVITSDGRGTVIVQDLR